jgi:hypothetical protein
MWAPCPAMSGVGPQDSFDPPLFFACYSCHTLGPQKIRVTWRRGAVLTPVLSPLAVHIAPLHGNPESGQSSSLHCGPARGGEGEGEVPSLSTLHLGTMESSYSQILEALDHGT